MKKEINKHNELEVYKAYLQAKGTKGYSVIKLCKRLGIPRPTLYAVVRRIEDGDRVQLNRCLNKSKYDCLWVHVYQRRFFVISDTEDKAKYHEQLKALIKDMKKEGFGVRDIGTRILKDPSTILYHLK